MRTLLPRVAAAAIAALALAACQQQTPSGEGASSGADAAERQRVQAEQQLASLGGRASRETRAAYEGDFTASGALEGMGGGEGAWELRLTQDYAEFQRPGLGEDGGLAGERDYREQGMRVTAGDLIITLKAENCPLPSGETLPYSASVLFEGVSYQGCAQRGVATADRPTWAAVLPELMPAIDACLRRVEGRSPRVTIASLVGEENLVTVRLRQGDGGRFGCVATLDGARIQAFDPLLDSDHLYGESDPEFIRAPANPPAASNCRSIEEVGSSAAIAPEPAEPGATPIEQGPPQLVGWLIRRTC